MRKFVDNILGRKTGPDLRSGRPDDQLVVSMQRSDGTTTGPHGHTGRFNLVTRTTAGDRLI
jgi:hypothetical protein